MFRIFFKTSLSPRTILMGPIGHVQNVSPPHMKLTEMWVEMLVNVESGFYKRLQFKKYIESFRHPVTSCILRNYLYNGVEKCKLHRWNIMYSLLNCFYFVSSNPLQDEIRVIPTKNWRIFSVSLIQTHLRTDKHFFYNIYIYIYI